MYSNLILRKKVDFPSRGKFLNVNLSNIVVQLPLDTSSDVTTLSDNNWIMIDCIPNFQVVRKCFRTELKIEVKLMQSIFSPET